MHANFQYGGSKVRTLKRFQGGEGVSIAVFRFLKATVERCTEFPLTKNINRAG